MKIIIGIITAVIIVIAGAVYYLYPTLYGLKPDFSNTPTMAELTNSSPASQNSEAKADLPVETIFTQGLDTPWTIAFLPDGNMLVTERKGTVRLVDKSGNLQAEPVATITNSKEIGEGGLLGIALHPKFSENNYVYLYYTFANSGDNTKNRVVRMKYQNGQLTNEEIIINNIPGASNHNGGRIKFGPDNYLYITTGDAQEPSYAQDKNSLAGKILRVTDEGKTVEGNLNNLVYSYGHRNPQGISWDQYGHLWETEHGPSGGSLGTGNDEVNLIIDGNNYGWPEIQGDQTGQGMVTPVRNSTPSVAWAPGGAAVVNDSLFFGGLRGQALYEALLENDKIIDFKEHFKGKYGRIRDVILGPDGMLYITTSNRDGRGVPQATDDRIIRINPQKL